MQRSADLDTPGRGDHGGFGGAVVIDHIKGLRPAERAQAVAADQQGAQGRMLQALAEGVLGHRCRQKAHVQRLRTPPIEQRVNVFAAVVSRRQVQRGPHAQCWPDFPGHRIKAEPGHAGGVAARVQVERSAVPVHQVRYAVVLDHHTFGQPRRARGVDHIGKV